MISGWRQLIEKVLGSLFMLLLIYTGLDVYFDNSASLNFLSALGLNFIFLFLGVISVLITFGFFFLFLRDGLFSDRVTSALSLVFSAALIYCLKAFLIFYYQLEFTVEPVVIIVEVLCMGLPLYFVYRALKEFGKGFMH